MTNDEFAVLLATSERSEQYQRSERSERALPASAASSTYDIKRIIHLQPRAFLQAKHQIHILHCLPRSPF